jgi:hypothetical protein
MVEPRTCPHCGALLILDPSNVVMDTEPPMYPYGYRCRCGHTEPGGARRDDGWRDEPSREQRGPNWHSRCPLENLDA